jgi:tRNA (guanine-N7-)-methyltransferase
MGLSRIFVLFPDPWPKKRHEKNRLLQHSLLTVLAGRALPGALLHFRTDHQSLFEWGLEQLETHPDWTVDPNEAWPLEAGSYFQDMLGVYKSVSARFGDASPFA